MFSKLNYYKSSTLSVTCFSVRLLFSKYSFIYSIFQYRVFSLFSGLWSFLESMICYRSNPTLPFSFITDFKIESVLELFFDHPVGEWGVGEWSVDAQTVWMFFFLFFFFLYHSITLTTDIFPNSLNFAPYS